MPNDQWKLAQAVVVGGDTATAVETELVMGAAGRVLIDDYTLTRDWSVEARAADGQEPRFDGGDGRRRRRVGEHARCERCVVGFEE